MEVNQRPISSVGGVKWFPEGVARAGADAHCRPTAAHSRQTACCTYLPCLYLLLQCAAPLPHPFATHLQYS